MAEILITDVTTGNVTGTGVFDKIMSAANAQLEKEYSAGRIRGGEYADVYVATMNSALQQSIAFVLGKQQADKQAELLAAQTLKTDKEQSLVNEQLLKTSAEIGLVNQQASNLLAQKANIPKEGAKLDSQKSLTDAQKLQTDAETLLIQQKKTNETITATNLTKQQGKLDAEIAVLQQKKRTEEAQIRDSVDGIAVTGIVGKQKALYAKQTEGYDRDAEQKLAKILADTWGIQRTTDNGVSANSTNRLDDSTIGAVINKAKAGIQA